MRRYVAGIAFLALVVTPGTINAQVRQSAPGAPVSLAVRPTSTEPVALPPRPAPGGTVRPIQVSLFFPVQAFPETDPIHGVRINFIYGKSDDVSGLDIGLVNQTTHSFLGVQWGAVGIVQGTSTGAQLNWLANVSQGTIEGLQWGIVNSVERGRGGQLGSVNLAQQYRGLQFGLVNYSQSLDGFQLGLINIIKQGGQFPVMILVNWGKGTVEELQKG